MVSRTAKIHIIICSGLQLFTFRAVTEIPFSASQIMLVASSDAVASRCVPGLNDNPLTWISTANYKSYTLIPP